MAVKAGEAFVEIFADSTKLQNSLKKASARLKSFGATATKIGAGVAGVGLALAAPFIKAISVFTKVGDELDKMSKRTGIAVESLSALGFAAEQSGASLAVLEKGIRTMQRSINDLERGLSTAKDAFGDLGITLSDIVSLNPEEQFKLIAQSISEITDPTKKAALAMQVLGKAGAQLIPLLEGGAEGIEAFTKEAEKLGLVVTGEEAAAAAEFTDEINILTRSFEKLFFNIGNAVLPVFKELRNFFQNLTTEAIRFAKQNGPLLQSLLKIALAAIAVGTAIAGFGIAVTSVGIVLSSFATIIGLVTSSMVFLTTAFGVVTSVIAILTIAVDLLIATYTILTSATALLSIATAALTGGVGLLTAAFALLTSPIALIIIGLAALVFHFGLIGKSLDAIGGAFTDFGSAASSIIDDVVKKVTAGDLEGAFSIVSENIRFIITNLKDSVVGTFSKLIDEIQVKANQLALIIETITTAGLNDGRAEAEFLSNFVKEEEERRDNASKARLQKIRDEGKAERDQIKKTSEAREAANEKAKQDAKNRLDQIKKQGDAAITGSKEEEQEIKDQLIEIKKLEEEQQDEGVPEDVKKTIEEQLTIDIDGDGDEDREREQSESNSIIEDLTNKLAQIELLDIAEGLKDPIESAAEVAGSFSGIELASESRNFQRSSLTAQQSTAKNTKDMLNLQRESKGVVFA